MTLLEQKAAAESEKERHLAALLSSPTMVENLNTIEAMRHRYLAVAFVAFLGFCFTATVYVLAKMDSPLISPNIKLFVMTPLSIITIILMIIFMVVPAAIYQTKTRAMLLPIIVGGFKGLHWWPEGCATKIWKQLESDYLLPTRFVAPYNSATVLDYITGSLRDINLSIVTLNLSNDADQDKRTKNEEIFRGAMVGLQLKTPSATKLIIRANQFGILNFHSMGSLVEVGIPAPEFTRTFHAYSNDQVMARTYLTTTFVERLLALHHSFLGKTLDICLLGNHLTLLVRGMDELARMGLFQNAHKNNSFRLAFEQLYLLLELMETLLCDWQLIPTPPPQV